MKTRELEELVNKTRKRRLPRGISRGGGTQDLEEVQGTPLGSLQERFAELSRSHRAVAAFVLSHMDEVAFLTAAKLARRCSTSEATIVRFAKKLGFPGFPEFQAQVRTLVRQKIGPAQKLKRTGPIPKQLNGLLDGVLDKAIVNLRATRKRLSGEMIEKVANLIINADDIYVIGLRGSAGVARTIGYIIGQLRPRVITLTEGGPLLLESLISTGPKDVVLAVSLPRYTRWTIDALQMARQQGSSTITMTDSVMSPAARVADVTLVAQTDAFYSNSYATIIFILDVLAAAILNADPETAHARLEAVERAFENHDFFFGSSKFHETAEEH